MESIISFGMILKDVKLNTRYRVVSLTQSDIILCEMDTSKFKLINNDIRIITSLLIDGVLTTEAEDDYIINTETLTAGIKNRYEKKKAIVSDVLNVYQNNLMALNGKRLKKELKEILAQYSMPLNSFWRMFTKYMQSGMKDYALVDERQWGTTTGMTYSYVTKPGKPSEYFGKTGVLITDEIKEFFDEAIKEYRSGRQKSLKVCYDRMNMLHFARTEIINGIPTFVLAPESERPTRRQFTYYANKVLSEQEKDAIKTSIQEQRNNKRLITSDSLYEVRGPGDMVEIDACEADVSLVSSLDPNRTVGRPIVYFMIDVYTRVILAASVSFDNNSILGITNLFLNLADDKQQYCKKYGLEFDNPAMWPSGIIPRRLRVDRGAEFKSREFDRICNELGIEKQIVPGASGSLKGIVEQSFHQMHLKQNAHLENYGLIEKRYDSEHHKEATLNIEQYTKMIINFVLTHNQEYDENYRLTRDMIEKEVKPIPCFLWDYGVKKYGNPKLIPVMNQYLFNLMTPIKAKLNRRGICFKSLYYLPKNDSEIAKEMFRAGNKKVPFEARMDMRDVGHVYYIRNGKLIDAPLNDRLTGNADFNGLTMKQYEEYLEKKKKMKAEGVIYNQELAVVNYSINEAVVSEAKKELYSESKNMRPAREIEKQKVSHEGKIAARLAKTKVVHEHEQMTSEGMNKKTKTKEYSSFEEALEDFWENN